MRQLVVTLATGRALLMEPMPDSYDRCEEDPRGFTQTLKKDFEKLYRWNPRSAIVGGADRMFVGRFFGSNP
jgi:hypothetical protein